MMAAWSGETIAENADTVVADGSHRFPDSTALTCLAVLLLVSLPAVADGGLFESRLPLEVTLEGPLTTVIATGDERRELPFTLRVGGEVLALGVRARGKSRLRVCDFAPLRLDFPSDVPATSPFAGQDKLKLVTHCKDGPSSEADLLQEYLAYRIFNLVSDVSFRVRLLRVGYIDTDDGAAPGASTHFAFVIESLDALAARIGGAPADLPGVSLAQLDDEQEARLYVFQYLIGNTDWSLVVPEGEAHCCHNGKLVDVDAKLFYVPYDFDLSGLVDARYAKPDPSLRIRSVTTRRYRGFCMDERSLAAALDTVVAIRSALPGLLAEVPALGEREAARTSEYLDTFFDLAADRERLLGRFGKRCL